MVEMNDLARIRIERSLRVICQYCECEVESGESYEVDDEGDKVYHKGCWSAKWEGSGE